MPPFDASTLIPEASPLLRALLRGADGPLQPPIRSEIFGLQRFAQHGRSLGETHRAGSASAGEGLFFPRLRNNIRTLRAAHRYIGAQASSGYDISPAAEWLLDNFHLIESQLKEIHEGLPRSYFRTLPVLLDEPLAGLPRIYGVAWAFVAHTDGAFDEALLAQFLGAYQETRELKLSEMWALPTTLRVVLIENLRRLAERLAANKAARETANLCCDRLDSLSVPDLDRLLAMLTRRGAGREFLGQMALRLQDRRTPSPSRNPTPYLDWLSRSLPDPAALQAQQSADQAADNLSVSNAVTSLRALGDAQWPDIIARTSRLMLLMLTSPAFEQEHTATRDQTLHGIERLARQWRLSELMVAQTLLDLMREEPVDSGMLTEAARGATHWIRGAGRPELLRALGVPAHSFAFATWRRTTWARHLALPAYLGALGLGSLGLVAWMLLRFWPDAGVAPPPAGWLAVTAVLMLFPASEAMVAVINRLVSESARPQRLPRLALVRGIPQDHRVMVVIPAMLGSSSGVTALVHRLELHFLANPERHAQFALLSDWNDAAAADAPDDAPLLAQAQAEIRALNARHAAMADGGLSLPEAPRFIVLHRLRRFSATEQGWIGWERKRGKLEQLVAALALGHTEDFLELGELSRIASDTRYVVTLDSDTQLPPGRLRELVGVAAHPHNRPCLDPSGQTVISGYGILQPRVLTPLPSRREATAYHWLFAGQCGVDPYSAATSEVYQDLFEEGSFSGKGLLHVGAVHAVMAGRLPEGQVLSHDLLEGAMARCAAVSDITVVEDAPFQADVAAARVHRWMRGDWQLLPFLLSPTRHALSGINRWKLFDNLRRSLVAPMSLTLLVLSLCGVAVSPWAVLALVLGAFTAGPLMGAVAGFSPIRDHVARWHFYRQAMIDLARALATGLWHLVLLLESARMALDAIVRALYRTAISHRHLLQWTTAETSQALLGGSFAAVARRHRATPLLALALLGGMLAVRPSMPWLTLVLCLAWASSPLSIWWVSRPKGANPRTQCPPADRAYLDGIARDTWRFFERCVGPQDHHLPPDNLQVLPHDILAHRTSPTNIGMYLLSTACAREFGWIGTHELLARVEATLTTLSVLQRHRGHFLNWYDTQTLAPLLPMYVSTVDSGNLCGHLLAVARACEALAIAPLDPAAAERALAASRARLAPLMPRWPDLLPALLGDSALARLLALPDTLGACRIDAEGFDALLRGAESELVALHPPSSEPTGSSRPTLRDELLGALADHVATARSAALDAQGGLLPEAAGACALRLRRVAVACEQLAWAPEFGFLYQCQRHLFHIGYRVAEQQLDAGFYDLLASESRLTSLLAIAKGEVPVNHWASLGRPFFAEGADAGLRSWSGSMFEYLMPTLVLEEPPGSVLQEAGEAALREQIEFARGLAVPWGLSESAYADRDHTLAYQYAPQGVPRLALRRTPIDQLVVAPYATALAAQIEPGRAARNFAALEALGARGRYGFIEALDFSVARQTAGEACTPVGTFMSHHQGMSIVALANVLLDGLPQRWGMATAHIQAVVSLLHERAPREVSVLHAPPSGLPLFALQRHAPGLLRQVLPGQSAIEPTHILSNGRYSVTLRANGAGWSQWGLQGISRTRDDALRDAHGSFVYLRRLGDSESDAAPMVSVTQHPAPDPGAHYESSFHADRVCFDARWSDVRAHTTVWVSPEDDIEFREVEIHNTGDEAIDVEIFSAFDVTLTEPRADEAHPAFTSLFVRAAWLPSHQALLFERTPRLPTELRLHAAHFIADSEPPVLRVRAQTDRRRWSGRNRDAGHPLADLDDMPMAAAGVWADESTRLDTGLDPCCALAVRLHIPAQGSAQVTFATAASDQSGTLRAVVDKYRQRSHVKRASLMSATLTDIRLRALRISAENFVAIQTLTTALVQSLTRPPATSTLSEGELPPVCDRRGLWRFGVSGDRPIVLVSASDKHGLNLLRALSQALRLWSWGGVACDLIVINSEPTSYQMTLQRELGELRELHGAEGAEASRPAALGVTGFHVLQAQALSADEQHTLLTLARIHLHADGRPLRHRVRAWAALHEQDYEDRQDIATAAVPTSLSVFPAQVQSLPRGEFVGETGEFRFSVGPQERPARPWINVMANADFGTQLSEAGGGCTWAGNSRMNQLTMWSNDPVADPASECVLLQDLRTRETWSVTAPSPHVHRVSHGQGWSRISHRRGEAEVVVTWCVDPHTSVKQIQLQVVNRGARTLQLRVIGLAEWMMGSERRERNTTHTALYRQRLPGPGQRLTALLCTQGDHAAGFGKGTGFLAMAGGPEARDDWTCDRRECFDARGRLVVPDHYGQRSGGGLDPCAALSATLVLAAGASGEQVFLLGYAESPDAARQLATVAAMVPAAVRLQAAKTGWDALLNATQVKTPDPLFDAMVNRWLLYQTVSCRLWSKAAFYQAGGATGFRDQLQDSLALAWAAPHMLREQILRCASRQFVEGDVQHWWHAPTGAGVRTHFSDDLLWLPHACTHYLQIAGDRALLDEHVSFLEGAPIPEGAEDLYDTPRVSEQTASVYEHAARTLDHSLRVGVHGLPLMGTGDWNDGMNRVGHLGRGESVWLGWFLCRLVRDWAPLARSRGDTERAQRWSDAARGWHAALIGPGWDGMWFKRAFFDDGQPLGSHANAEARIDLIAQAWAVLSGATSPTLQHQALDAVERKLVDTRAGLIKLLDPPLAHAEPSAGYIQAYPPGVRENGGQYSHAGVWALMAQVQAVDAARPFDAPFRGDTAYRYFTYLSPAHRSAHPERGAVYGLEPYAMAGDVYSQPPYVGRGGWSWYTGAAAWLHRAAIESMFGLRIDGNELSVSPCLPSAWPQAELTLRHKARTMRFILTRAVDVQALIEESGAQTLGVGERITWTTLAEQTCFVVSLAPAPAPALSEVPEADRARAA